MDRELNTRLEITKYKGTNETKDFILTLLKI